MESTTSAALVASLPHPPATTSRRPFGLGLLERRRTTVCAAKKRDGYGSDYGGGLVDENMIVLRKRIHEMKMAERNYEPPSDWMLWEKRWYTSYDSNVCEVVGLLQTLLMNTRPSVGIALMVLLVFSMPASMIMITFHLITALSGLHLN